MDGRKRGDGMRLIDADAISYESIDSSDTEKCFAKYGTGILAVRKEDIDEMPTVEPQIIRCKDCNHYKYGMCMKICANKSTNGFCDWGER